MMVFGLPRWIGLDHYVTVDERHWLVRSANFTQALTEGSYTHTFQQGHPGVTVMWLGTVGYWLQFPDYGFVAPGQFTYSSDAFDLFVAEQGYASLELLVAGRQVVVVANMLLLLLAWWLLRLVFKQVWPGTPWLGPDALALLAILLIGLHPFLVGHSRLLHPDSLLWPLMFVSLLGYLGVVLSGGRDSQASRSLDKGRTKKPILLLISGVAAGLSWLTKTPSFYLVPFMGLMAVCHGLAFFCRGARIEASAGEAVARIGMRRSLTEYLVWVAVGLCTFFLLWPALWVAPIETLAKMVQISQGYAAEGHDSAIFFLGQIVNRDPGFWFYPVTYLWRASPIDLLGLGLLAVCGVVVPFTRKGKNKPNSVARSVLIPLSVALLIFSLGFWLFMNWGAKKFDRYLLPVYAPLTLASALGWCYLFTVLATYWPRDNSSNVEAALVARTKATWGNVGVHSSIILLLALLQAVLLLLVSPTYLSYYNPLMGGARAAPEKQFLGWGQGLAEAAHYINNQSSDTPPKVATWYGRGPLSYYLDGEFLSSHYYWQADYTIVYANQRQRQAPARQLMAHWNQQPAAFTATLDGIDYAEVYETDKLPLPRFVTDWNKQIRLISYTLNTGAVKPGQEIQLELYLLNLAPIDVNLNMLVRIVKEDGTELLRSDRWPFGAATSDWQQDELWVDRFNVTIPEGAGGGLYRVEIEFYDPSSLLNLPVTEATSGEFLGETLVLDYVEVDYTPNGLPTHACPPDPDLAIADFSGLVSLIPQQVERVRLSSGEQWQFTLCWETQSHLAQSYTTFAHLIDQNGQLVAQHDEPPLSGFVPMVLWYPGLIVADSYMLQLPQDITPGDYQLHIGLYDPQTGDRLPIRVGENQIDSAYPFGTVEVQ